jgi:hypothetical protein
VYHHGIDTSGESLMEKIQQRGNSFTVSTGLNGSDLGGDDVSATNVSWADELRHFVYCFESQGLKLRCGNEGDIGHLRRKIRNSV